MPALLKWRGHRWLALASRLALAGTFLVAWWTKIRDPGLFALQLAAYELLPIWLVRVVAASLPWLELGVALLLVSGTAARWAAAVAASLLVVFVLTGATAIARGLELSCGCFGEGDPVGAWSLTRSGVLCVMAVYVLLVDRVPLGVEALLRR